MLTYHLHPQSQRLIDSLQNLHRSWIFTANVCILSLCLHFTWGLSFNNIFLVTLGSCHGYSSFVKLARLISNFNILRLRQNGCPFAGIISLLLNLSKLMFVVWNHGFGRWWHCKWCGHWLYGNQDMQHHIQLCNAGIWKLVGKFGGHHHMAVMLIHGVYLDGLVQERCKSSALTMYFLH